MAVYLNGTKVPGYDQKVSAVLPLAGEDLSGQSSNSQQAQTGDKPKQLSVSTNIKFDDADDLKTLIALAESRDGNEERTIYTIVNPTADAMNIRQMRFQGDVNVKESDDVEAWSVAFKLIEYRSVPEKKEARALSQPIKDQAAAGKPIVPDTTADSTNTVQQLSDFEHNVLKPLSDLLE